MKKQLPGRQSHFLQTVYYFKSLSWIFSAKSVKNHCTVPRNKYSICYFPWPKKTREERNFSLLLGRRKGWKCQPNLTLQPECKNKTSEYNSTVKSINGIDPNITSAIFGLTTTTTKNANIDYLLLIFITLIVNRFANKSAI